MTRVPRPRRLAVSACAGLAALVPAASAQALPFVAEAYLPEVTVIAYAGPEDGYVPFGEALVSATFSFHYDSDDVFDVAGAPTVPILSVGLHIANDEGAETLSPVALDYGDAFAQVIPDEATLLLLADMPGDGSSVLIPLAFVAGTVPPGFAFDSGIPAGAFTGGVLTAFNEAFVPLPFALPGSPVTAVGIGGFGTALAARDVSPGDYTTGPMGFGIAASTVPAPAALPLAAAAIGALGLFARRRREA